MIMCAPPLPQASWNNIDAINRVITHAEVYGEHARIVDVQDRLVIALPGIVVGFREVQPRIHECHQAVIPAMRGKKALSLMRQIRDWWWEVQPSDLLVGTVPENKRQARFVMHALGFTRWGEVDAPCPDGINRRHTTYGMERPK
ncbi:DUF2824 family protein [Neokomagataea anthophila]|uniref:DUF2824 family protein n=1 Tax=Neokomagataea anthophila TaxID=2826925 RepID=A0ABS5E810_9PROT|nr:DUF2824 family protein [Neokomagataea anthophila]MBR0560050.1 DUF2824 family protein [Neokomagataea anthophila]